jgi:hypothetical protein
MCQLETNSKTRHSKLGNKGKRKKLYKRQKEKERVISKELKAIVLQVEIIVARQNQRKVIKITQIMRII